MQGILKPEDRAAVIIDDRERSSLISDLLKKLNVILNWQRLEVGDFILSDRCCIERKTFDDFAASIADGRLFKQLEELKRNFERPMLILEGRALKRNVSENAVKAAMAATMLQYDIPILMTGDVNETAKIIYWLAKKEQIDNKRVIGIKGKKKPKEINLLQEHAIASLPGISAVLSKRILNEFKSVKNFLNSKEDDIAKIKGVGRKQAKKLWKIINEKYDGDK